MQDLETIVNHINNVNAKLAEDYRIILTDKGQASAKAVDPVKQLERALIIQKKICSQVA